MIYSVVGHYSLILGLCVSLILIFFSIQNFKNSNQLDNKILSFSFLQLFFVLISFLALIISFVVSDFSNETVFNNSHTTKPLFYKISGTWGNHEGSLLLWLLVLTLFIFIFLLRTKNQPNKYKILTLGFQQVIIIGFFLFLIQTSNPFNYLFPVPDEGLGLNPILQDPALAIHPPILYLGYVGSSIIFSSALAATTLKMVSTSWAAHIKKWVLVSWIFLTLGILLGSIWAYYELGWGGFWFWDPVENASLLPWLTATALLHSILVVEKKETLITWTILLSIITFSLSLLGTFLVRSGVLVSVHAFANDPSRGLFILIMLLSIFGVGIFFFLKNYRNFLDNKNIEVLSKEGAISLNNIFMVTISATILLGTIYPLISDAFFDKKISVGAPFYNAVILPFVGPLILGMILGPFLRWGRDDILKVFNRLRPLIGILFLVTLVYWYFENQGPVISIISFTLAIWLITSSLFEIFYNAYLRFKNGQNKFWQLPKRIFAQAFAHIGVALVIIGATGGSVLKEEKIQFQELGEFIKINDYEIQFSNVENKVIDNYRSDYATFKVYKNNEFIKNLYPEKRYYNTGKQVTTEAAIHSTLFGDIYIAIGERNESFKDMQSWTTRIWFNPFIIWIWAGVFFMASGGIISLLNSYKKI